MKTAKIKVKLDHSLINSTIKSGSKRATWSALDYLATESKKQVPLDKGPLKASCEVDVNDDGSEGTVSYDTPYAVVQHENTWYHHQRGRKAKYLEDPLFDKQIQRNMLDIAKKSYGM